MNNYSHIDGVVRVVSRANDDDKRVVDAAALPSAAPPAARSVMRFR